MLNNTHIWKKTYSTNVIICFFVLNLTMLSISQALNDRDDGGFNQLMG
jgi:hypothetical protein